MTRLPLRVISALGRRHVVVVVLEVVEALLAQPEADRVQGAVAAVAVAALLLHRRAALVPAGQEVLGRLRPRGQVHRPAHQAPLRQRRRVQTHQVAYSVDPKDCWCYSPDDYECEIWFLTGSCPATSWPGTSR